MVREDLFKLEFDIRHALDIGRAQTGKDPLRGVTSIPRPCVAEEKGNEVDLILVSEDLDRSPSSFGE